MLPEYYEFQNSTKILSGENALEHIPFELNNLGVKKPCILTGSQGFESVIIGTFKGSSVVAGHICKNVPRDSSAETINKAVQSFRKNSCDCIIAVGGGSVIDTAKGVLLLLSQDADDIMKLAGSEVVTRGNRVPFIAVPTTSGTGSEATACAVIKDTGRNLKMEFTSYNLLPDIAVLDIRMTLSLPRRITASTGMDALTHAIEAYSCMQKNPISDAYAVAAIDLIRGNLLNVVQNPDNGRARLAMANAAMLAGASFSNSMVGLVHAIGHACGGICGVAHGDAMNILLPHCMDFNFDSCADDYANLLPWLCGEVTYTSTPPQERAARVIAEVRSLSLRLNEATELPLKLSDCGVTEDHLPEIAKAAINDGAMLLNRRHANEAEVLEILKAAM